jgi:hypothetical protein
MRGISLSVRDRIFCLRRLKTCVREKKEKPVQGIISTYHLNSRSGIIRGLNGSLYLFGRSEWQSASLEPRPGISVLFEPGRRSPVPSQAFRIIPHQSTPWSGEPGKIPGEYREADGTQAY